MKKKIFLITLMVALFVCLFVISASAAEMFTSEYTSEITKFYDTEGTTELKPSWCSLADQNATAVIVKADGTAIRIPLYYIYHYNGTTFYDDERADNSGSAGFKFAWISETLGETISRSNLVALDIPEGITKVNTINNCKALEEVVFPLTATSFPKSENHPTLKKAFAKQTKNGDGSISGITAVSDYAFKNAKALEYFAMELDYATYIGPNAFLNAAIKEIRLEGPFTGMGGAAFSGCASLETVYLNNTSGNQVDPGQVFKGASSLKSVTLNGFRLSDYSFENVNALTSGGLTVTATNVGAVGQMAFKNTTNLSSVTLSGVTSLGSSVFLNCTNLKSVDISGPITSIGSYLFSGSKNLESLKIVNTLEAPATCGNDMCKQFKNLKSIELHGISIGVHAFYEIDGTDMTVRCTNVGSIGSNAFYKAANITELYLSGPFTKIDSATFRECPKLTKITLINTGDTVVSAGNGESNPALTDLRLEGKFEIGSPAFQNNTALKNIYLGTGVQTIGAQAFYQCYALETAYLADTITAIADNAFDMNGSGKQTSTSFMFVDENGNMDNTLPTSLKSTGGHFLKGYTFANTQLIYPTGYTSAANSAYDFESAVWPEGFNIVYLGKMTTINYNLLYRHNNSRNVTIYLAGNSASDLSGERINVNIAQDGSMSHGTYAGSTTGTLEIVINDDLHNNIKATSYVKFYFCGSNEVVFVTRVNIPREEGGSNSWGNFVSMPVTYEQLQTAYNVYNTANPDAMVELPAKHPVLTAPEFSPADCTNDGGIRVFCVGCGALASFEKTEDALGHNHDIMNATSIVYADYTKDGVFTAECLRCNELVTETVVGSYLFKYNGISTSTSGTGLCVGYILNKEFISAYSSLKGDAFEYGMLATIVTGENNNPLSPSHPTNVIRVGLTDKTELSAVDMVVRGDYTAEAPGDESAYDVYSLAMSLYVIDDANNYYIWDNAETVTANNTVVTTTTIYVPKKK